MEANNVGQARGSVSAALAIAVLWLSGMGGYALTAHGISDDFRAHLLTGLGIFSVVIVGPLLLVLVTLNWVVRRVAGAIITLLFFGMARGAASQGFGPVASTAIVFVCALLVGGMLFFLSRPAVMSATDDFYNFVRIRDVLSKYAFRRKPEGA